MAGHGVWDGNTWRPEQANRAGYYDAKFGSEAVTDKIENRLGFIEKMRKLSDTFA
jgi:hypothetical protein